MEESGGTLITLAIILAAIQFLYRVWDKKDNKQILEAIGKSVQHFDPHIERTKRTYGIVKSLQAMHEVRDDDGRPLMYLPKELLETQRELVSIAHVHASTQESIIKLLEKMDNKIDIHKDQCKEQFQHIERKVDR